METPAQRFVLFDFDGVIADSLALAYDVARIVHPEANLTQEGYVALFEGNVYESIKKASWGEVRDDKYFAHYSPRMKGEVTLVPDMKEVIADLAAAHTLIIVSSTVSAAIQGFLAPHSLDGYFAEVMGSDVHKSKVDKMRMIFEKYETTPDRCIFITDTLGDMREAKEHEMGAIGVSWGWHDRATLEKGIPFRIVDKPAELPDAVDDYFARASL